MRLREAGGGYDKLLGLVAVDRRDQRVAGGKMAVERPGPDTSGARDLIEAGADGAQIKIEVTPVLRGCVYLRCCGDRYLWSC
jgi:hypothetical protein